MTDDNSGPSETPAFAAWRARHGIERAKWRTNFRKYEVNLSERQLAMLDDMQSRGGGPAIIPSTKPERRPVLVTLKSLWNRGLVIIERGEYYLSEAAPIVRESHRKHYRR